MADQNFMDLASKTASGIAGTDYMMLVNNSEAYKALVNDVAEAILSKLTSKSFSGLKTTAKNVIGALNELNSKMVWKNNPNTEDVLSNRAMYFGLLNYGASSDINYPYRYTTFYISISDSWASTIISVPYSTDTDNKIHFGLYDKSSLTWTWV